MTGEAKARTMLSVGLATALPPYGALLWPFGTTIQLVGLGVQVAGASLLVWGYLWRRKEH